MDEENGEILVMQDACHSCIEMHIRGVSPDEYRVVRLTRHEARRLAAIVLYQAERLGRARLVSAGEPGGFGLKSA